MSAVSISSSCSHQLHHSSKELITSHSLASIHFPRKGQNTSTNFDINNECSAKSSVKAAPQRLKWRTRVSFFPSFSIKDGDIETLKQELLEAIAALDRGAEATAEDQERVDQIARKLEAVNKVKEPLKSSLLNGKWELLYTTSKSVLQPQRPKLLRPNGKMYQAINVDTLRAQNMETWPFFNQATANLVPLNTRRVAVKFDSFKIAGVIPIMERGSGRGELEITYLDEELRISRGNQGNLFILRMVDPSYRVPL
ncbi:probable plastid-lipid-associated protein 4, chloroplastic isoform X1 [Coffea eugenioides]|uniref:Probable plastid-lipid-associated protein 4, chloroplastic isoform X1 n=1 Tax=Coffea arabica TaxID=13443 RepID=A0ABM4WVM9_COFAR|nr:probable plastid-lipid-associated protein 4, chloroplastic isoform X1 [Coffea eugenioides]XP_027160444.1 probable plastid-lipid-associated protein 4, chloroplastic isoform X1 [Coffea eugenioides]XP_027164010.1 probable plastid-lipid-associated protein 4, chloroplastic isoform X1 [Coffea eugenioides]